MYLSKEDYEEPCCPLKNPNSKTTVPLRIIIEKLDSYLNRNDYESAEKHLRYWYDEAHLCGDNRGMLTILNEQIGLYRKINKEAEGINAIEAALSLAQSMNIENTETLGTTYINAATGYKAFCRTDDALVLYKKAQKIYESVLESYDKKLGGLYNNMALALADAKKYGEAEEFYRKAIRIMEHNQNCEGEIAITYLNLADLVAAEKGMENAEEIIGEYIDKAEALLETESLPKDGYYAFVCEKCASVFGYYGYFLAEKKFRERAKEIYERS